MSNLLHEIIQVLQNETKLIFWDISSAEEFWQFDWKDREI